MCTVEFGIHLIHVLKNIQTKKERKHNNNTTTTTK